MKKNFDKTKILSKNSKMSTEGAHIRLLLQLFEMPLCGIMFERVKENFEKERLPRCDSFTFYSVAVSQACL